MVDFPKPETDFFYLILWCFFFPSAAHYVPETELFICVQQVGALGSVIFGHPNNVRWWVSEDIILDPDDPTLKFLQPDGPLMPLYFEYLKQLADLVESSRLQWYEYMRPKI